MTGMIPHPVLMPGNTDYIESSSFDTKMVGEPQRTLDKHINISLDFELNSRFINTQIKRRRAEFLLMIRCVKTYKREIHRTSDKKITLRLPLDEYVDKISIFPYVVSTDEIKNFASEEHNDEFGELTMNIPKGSILAMSDSHELKIDSFQTLRAAIRLTTDNKIKENGKYLIDISGDYIDIKMNKYTHQKVQNLRRTTGERVLSSALYMTVLAYAIQNMEEENNDLKWAEALGKSVEGCRSSVREDPKEKPYRFAQYLLRNPLGRIFEPERNGES